MEKGGGKDLVPKNGGKETEKSLSGVVRSEALTSLAVLGKGIGWVACREIQEGGNLSLENSSYSSAKGKSDSGDFIKGPSTTSRAKGRPRGARSAKISRKRKNVGKRD